MRKGLIAALSLVSSFALAESKEAAKPAAAAAAPPAMEMPKPSQELADASKYFMGKWTCTGKAMMPAEHATKGKLELKMVLGNFWLSMNFDHDKTKVDPMPMGGMGVVGWDTSKNELMRTDWMSGGSWLSFTSKGWEGDKQVWAGEGMMMGKRTKVTHTLTKKSDKEFDSVFEMPGPDGKMMAGVTENCKKAGK
jgi:hypothetical protein